MAKADETNKDTEVKDTNTTPEETQETKKEEPKFYKLIKNVKFGDEVHKIGEKIEISAEHLEEFIKAKVIKIDEE